MQRKGLCEGRGRTVIYKPQRSHFADSSHFRPTASRAMRKHISCCLILPLHFVVNPGKATHLLGPSFLMRSNSEALELECQPIFREHILTQNARHRLAGMEDRRDLEGAELHLQSLILLCSLSLDSLNFNRSFH